MVCVIRYTENNNMSNNNKPPSLIERKMTKGVTIALNMQSWTDAAEGSEAEEPLFLTLEYKF